MVKDETRCIASVWSGFSSQQCSRPRGHGKDGMYCKQHDPEAIEAKRKSRNAKWEAEWAESKKKQDKVKRVHEAHEPMLAALKAAKLFYERTFECTGGCDHSVGICECGDHRDYDVLCEAILKAEGKQ